MTGRCVCGDHGEDYCPLCGGLHSDDGTCSAMNQAYGRGHLRGYVQRMEEKAEHGPCVYYQELREWIEQRAKSGSDVVNALTLLGGVRQRCTPDAREGDQHIDTQGGLIREYRDGSWREWTPAENFSPDSSETLRQFYHWLHKNDPGNLLEEGECLKLDRVWVKAFLAERDA